MGIHNLTPLQQSAAYDAVEAQLKALTIRLWQKHMADAAQDISVYCAPHWGSRDLMLKNLKNDGIASFNTVNLERDNARYLLLAERHNNQKRGLHFLRTFIKCAWGNDFQINQLWQKKSEPYPTCLKTADEITAEGEDRNDYFLTSRLSIELSGFVRTFPSDVARSVRSVLAARLFVTKVFRTLPLLTELGYAHDAQVVSLSTMSSNDTIDETCVFDSQVFVNCSEAASLASLTITL
ncbi:hypothetical protein [Hydromonas duriensis]|uniref:Uncharacterized protein n=1 Tax=Hydromonas duriensis TaxID=1527608 RepID=A0A4R6Y533_9BURK|nr:hypothetical protein [Hydromonas duriensis]TDR30354.1 hypothetical protein DFR44_12223 [Hydromonas duriensis]